MEEKKWGTYKVSIDNIGRKWTQVTIHYPSGYTHAATIDKNSLLDHSVGDEVDVLGCLHGAPANGRLCGAKRPRCGTSGHLFPSLI